MNADFPQNEREQLEAKLTALLLGELPANEAIEIGKAMEADPELKALYERLKVTIGLVRESAVQPAAGITAQAQPLKLSAERREKLLAQFKTVTPKEFAKPTPKFSLLLQFAAMLAVLSLLAAMLLPALSKAKSKAMNHSVINNLRLLDGAKQQWALENSKASSATANFSDVQSYLGRGNSDVQEKQLSIAGEAYVLGRVSERPSVEMSVSQARKMFGSKTVARGETHDGKVRLSLDDIANQNVPQRVPGEVAQSKGPEPSLGYYTWNATATGGSAMTVTTPAPPAPKAEIVLFGGQPAPSREPQWIGALERRQPSTTNNGFVSRYAYTGPQPGQTIDIAGVQGQAATLGVNPDLMSLDDSAPGETGLALKGVAVTNLLAAASGNSENKLSVLGDLPGVGRLFRSEPNLAGANGRVYGGLASDDVGGLRYQATDGTFALQTTRGAATNWVETLDLADSGGGPTQKTEIVLPAPLGVPTGHSMIVANGGSMPSRGFGGGGYTPVPAKQIPPVTLNYADVNTNSNRAVAFDFEQTTGVPVRTASEDIVIAEKTAPYFAAKDQLENEKRWRQILAMKTRQEEVDKNLPKSKMVSISDPATVGPPEKESLGQKIRETFSGKVERSTRVSIEQERPDISGLAGPTVGASYDPYFIQTEFESIKSAAVLQKAVKDLKLDGGDKSKTQAAVERLRKNIEVSPVKNTKYIEITAKNAKPEEAARIANAVAQAYKDYRADEYDELKNHGIESLKQQLVEQDKKVQLAQARVDELRKSLGVNDSLANTSGAEYLMTADRQKELAGLRVQQEAEYNRQKTLLDKLKAMDPESLKKALPIATADTQLNTLLSELDLAEQAFIKLKIDYAPNSPKYQSAQELVNDLNRKINDHVNGIVTGLDSKVAASKASLDKLKQEEQEQEKIDGSPESKIHIPIPASPPQPEILTRENAFSTFSLNVSDVSFKLAAVSLEKGQMPEPVSIRSEEFINAFNYRDPDAGPGVPIAFASERTRYPFAHNRELLRFSLKTAAAGRQAGRPLNIVLLLDNSGSMERADRVRIIQEALRVLAGQLQASDTFSIVTFARTATLRVDGVHGNQAAAAAAEIAKLTPEGGTNLGDALDLAYETALHHYLANGDNRVVLLTDGAANLGDVNPDALKQKVEAHRKQGVALDCFGIGWEDYNDDLLEVLTRNGDGRYGFINKPEEASTEFAGQIAGALRVAASDVKVQVEFNPKRVTSYRQIGYAKHQLTKEQFRDNTVDAAEIAAQEAGNALYTIETNPQGEGSIATVRVRYKVPATGEYREQAWDVPYTGSAVALEQASPAMRLATTASAFSEWLATSPFAAEISTDQLLRYLNGVPKIYGADTRPAKLEWMIRQAKSISGK